MALLSRCILILLLFSPGVRGDAPDGESVEQLVAQRLALMKEVAAYKWHHNLPVEDADRENTVLEAAIRSGLRYGLTRQSSGQLFTAQMSAAREIQAYWLARWHGGNGAPGSAPDLAGDIRPHLLSLGDAIVAAAAREPVSARDAFLDQIATEGLSPERAGEIYSALSAVDRYPDRLSQILDSGMLRIGTTGDYEPFSFTAEGSEALRGIDIDLGRDLAVALGVTPVFVLTSWPTLMADLTAGKFDIAMGGVSRTLERQRRGFFSQPYHIGGKTVLARCADARRFVSLAAVDRPEVRVIVNPGGTNEQFVNARLRHVEKVLHRDNRTIFAEIAEGRADLMITDRIEAEWQATNDPRLCVPVAGNFTYQQKAYLMPRDIALKEFVDTWLALRKAQGRINKLLSDS